MPAALPQQLGESTDPARRKLMEAAGEIFAEQGFQGATVREICARAGANVAAVNYYFGDKEGLYVEVLRQATSAGNATAEIDAAAIGGPEAALRTTIFSMCRRLKSSERPSWAIRLMAHEMSRPTEALGRVVEEVIAPSYLRLRKNLGALLQLPPGHRTTRLCAHSVIAQIMHYKTSQPVISRLWPELTMTDQDVDMIAEHIFEFSLCSVKSIARKARNEKHAH